MMPARRSYRPGGMGYPGYSQVSASGPFGGHATLATNLEHYWKLEEASGTRNDEIGGSHLTDNNTVTSAAGKSGNAASFIAGNSEYLSHTGVSVEAYSGFTIDGWLYVDSTFAGGAAATGKWNARGWNLFATNAGAGVTTPRFYCFGNGQNDSIDWTSTVPADAFYHFLVYYDGAVIGIRINGGTPVTTAHTVPPDDTGLDFNIGRTTDGAGYLTGRWDEFAIWSRALTAQEQLDRYNSGAGRFY